MPQIGTEWIRVETEEGVGEPFTFKSTISVNREGIFNLTIPVELWDTAARNLEGERYKGIGLVHLTKHYAVSSKSKEDGLRFVRKVVADYLRCEVIRETVIVYSTTADVKYWKTAEGRIVPHGGWDPNYSQQGGSWGGGKNESGNGWHEQAGYNVGLTAAVYVKVTARRASGDQIRWERAGENNHQEPELYLDKLNQFSMRISPYDLGSMHCIPYTEEAAKFFFDAIMAICSLSDRLENFFGNPENVQKAIESRAGFMLGAGGEK